MYLMRLCGFAAIAALASATGAVAAATPVNIADPNATTRAAHVEPGNRLAVQEVAPTSYFHATRAGLTPANGCVVIANAPPGKALILRQARVNTSLIQNAGGTAQLYANGTCDNNQGIIGTVTPGGMGISTVGFDPGLAIPTGGAFSAVLYSINGDVYVDGYTVAASVAPAAGQTIEASGTPQHAR
jgi:hypothetical protein